MSAKKDWDYFKKVVNSEYYIGKSEQIGKKIILLVITHSKLPAYVIIKWCWWLWRHCIVNCSCYQDLSMNWNLKTGE